MSNTLNGKSSQARTETEEAFVPEDRQATSIRQFRNKADGDSETSFHHSQSGFLTHKITIPLHKGELIEKRRRRTEASKKCISQKHSSRQEEQSVEEKQDNKLKDVLDKNRYKFFVNLFQEKALRNSPHRAPVDFDPYSLRCESGKELFLKRYRMELNKSVEYLLTFIRIPFMMTLIFTLPLSFVFQELRESVGYHALGFCCLFFSLFDLFSGIFLAKPGQQHHLEAERYIRKQLPIDLITVVLVSVTLYWKDEGLVSFLRLAMLTKAFSYFEGLEKIEFYFFSASYAEKYWSLVKIFINNLVVCHILAVVLAGIAQVQQPGATWMTAAGIDEMSWQDQYIFSYYFGITIVTTIGFGDFHATNPTEALTLIFVCIFSCVFFGYNINYIGNLINSIKEQEVEKQEKLRALNGLAKKADISEGVYQEISKYIVESTNIKREFNLQEEASLLEFIPESLRSSFLQETNLRLFNHLRKIVLLSNKTIERLALTVQAKICHPDESIRQLRSPPSLIILQNGAIGYTSKKANSLFNNLVVEEIRRSFHEESKIICISVLTQEELSYEIKSLDYSLVYKMEGEEFEDHIRQSRQDFQIYRELKDKCRYQLNEFGLTSCRLCRHGKHTLFECPRLHFMPLKQTTIYKFLKQAETQKRTRQKRAACFRQKSLLSRRFQVERDGEDWIMENSVVGSQGRISIRGGTMISQLRSFEEVKKQRSNNLSMMAFIKEEIQNLKKTEGGELFKFSMWDIDDCDEARDYQYYFPKQNSSRIYHSLALSQPMHSTVRTFRKLKRAYYNTQNLNNNE